MKRLLTILFAAGLCFCSFGQDFDDAFKNFEQKNQKTFNSFRDSINKAFAEALAANIKTFSCEEPLIKDQKPKPGISPKYPDRPLDAPSDLPGLKPKGGDEPGLPEGKESPQETPDNVSPNPTPEAHLYRFDFTIFGEKIDAEKKDFPKGLRNISPNEVSEFWSDLSECDCSGIINNCVEKKEKRFFNDWAIYNLAKRFAWEIYGNKYDEQVAMTVFLLNQLGVESKIGFADDHLFCLLNIKQQLYGVSFVDIRGKRYYIFEVNPKFFNQSRNPLFRTYDIAFPLPTNSIDMNVRKPLIAEEKPVGTNGNIRVNMSMIELFSTYPQVDIDVYANAEPSYEFRQSVEDILSPYLNGLTESDAVAFLLAYVQYGFEYATDDDQFGYEKPFFCEENYYYPHNDCEDRSVLFAFLVRHLLGLEVVLIDYPGHLAAAVRMAARHGMATVGLAGKEYVICDPTYIGAPPGTEMPEFTLGDRKLILLPALR